MFLYFYIGQLLLKSLRIFGKLNTSLKIYFTTKAILKFYDSHLKSLQESEIEWYNRYTFQFSVFLRDCEVGEVYKENIKT